MDKTYFVTINDEHGTIKSFNMLRPMGVNGAILEVFHHVNSRLNPLGLTATVYPIVYETLASVIDGLLEKE